MDDDCPMIHARFTSHVLFERVQHHVEPGVAVHMNVNLIVRVPIDPETSLKEVQIHHPLTFVPIQIAIPHLHGL